MLLRLLLLKLLLLHLLKPHLHLLKKQHLHLLMQLQLRKLLLLQKLLPQKKLQQLSNTAGTSKQKTDFMSVFCFFAQRKFPPMIS